MTRREGVLPHVFTSSVFFTLAFVGLFGFSSDASAAVKNYIGPDSGSWNTAANWSPSGVPSATDDVFISSSTASIEVQLPVSQTASFKSLTISTSTATMYNASLLLSGTIATGTDIIIEKNGRLSQDTVTQQVLGGTLTVKNTGILNSYRFSTSTLINAVNFKAQTIDIQAGAIVSGNAFGYHSGMSAGNEGYPAAEIGGGQGSMTDGGGGGGAGGAGGDGTGGTGGIASCTALDIINNPVQAGFGAGGGAGSTGGDEIAGTGGGLILLESIGTTTINGIIRSNGEAANGGTNLGGGGGGGVRLIATAFEGTPAQLSAVGGVGGSTGGGGGGGGCFFVIYRSSTSFADTAISVGGAAGGTGATGGATGVKYVKQLPLQPLSFNVGYGVQTATSSGNALTWVSPGGNGSFYYIERSSDFGQSYSFQATTTAASSSYPTPGLTPAFLYYYRIAYVSSTIGTSSFAYGNWVTQPVQSASSTISSLGSDRIGLTLNPGLNYASSSLGVKITASSTGSNVTAPLLSQFNENGTQVGGGFIIRPYTIWSGFMRGLTPSTTYNVSTDWRVYHPSGGSLNGGDLLVFSTTTLLATPGAPIFAGESSTTINLSWTHNGNPTSTPYAVYNETLNKFHLNDGTLSDTPVFSPISSWNGTAKQLSPATTYNFRIVLRKEDGSQYATSSASSNYTLNANGSVPTSGGSGGGSTMTTTSSGTTSGGTTSGGSASTWYFGTGGGSTSPTTTSTLPTPTTLSPTTGGTTYTLPDGTIITPQMVFQMMNVSGGGSTSPNLPSVSLYKGKNLSSNIAFSRFSTSQVPFLTSGTLSFRYTYQNPNPTRTYRIERVLVNPLGTVVARSTAQRLIARGQIITYNPSQFISRTLPNGLYTVRVRITSLDGKTIFDENTFDLELKRR